MAKTIWSREAREDLRALVLHMSRIDGRPATAAKTAREIKAKSDEYASHFVAGNIMGTHRPELGNDYRTFTYKRWVVVFRPIREGIEVMRLIDGARDFPTLFGG